jgi:hypothetical protein
MSENQSSAKSTVEGELSLDDLEKIAGGTADLASTAIDLSGNDTSILKPSDNLFTAQGGSEENKQFYGNSTNLTLAFP